MAGSTQVTIVGAGIAGISAAYFLMTKYGIRNITLIDERPPLSLTSDKSTECYRNWWPGPDNAMTSLMNRSITLLQELADQSQNIFHLNQRGYLYATADFHNANAMRAEAELISSLGAGALRIHSHDLANYPADHPEDFSPALSGADWIENPDLIQQAFPYLNPATRAVLHVRRAGWFSAQQLGAYMLNQCRQMGLKMVRAKVSSFRQVGGRVIGVEIDAGDFFPCERLILAAGPFLERLAAQMGIDLPITNELHLKASIRDHQAVIPRKAPLIIWKDAQYINWSEDEKAFLAEDPETAYLALRMSGGCHTRPDGGPDSQIILLLWEYKTELYSDPVLPPPLDQFYPEIALRGMSCAIPGLTGYIGKIPRPWVDGGYYTRTPENRPLIGPLPLEGVFISGAYSGYGLMAACAAGELVAAHVIGHSLPEYAPAFLLDRYQNPSYLAQIKDQANTGQL